MAPPDTYFPFHGCVEGLPYQGTSKSVSNASGAKKQSVSGNEWSPNDKFGKTADRMASLHPTLNPRLPTTWWPNAARNSFLREPLNKDLHIEANLYCSHYRFCCWNATAAFHPSNAHWVEIIRSASCTNRCGLMNPKSSLIRSYVGPFWDNVEECKILTHISNGDVEASSRASCIDKLTNLSRPVV